MFEQHEPSVILDPQVFFSTAHFLVSTWQVAVATSSFRGYNLFIVCVVHMCLSELLSVISIELVHANHSNDTPGAARQRSSPVLTIVC